MPTTRATELAQVGSLVSADPSASTVTVSGSVVTNAGTAAAPAIAPTGDTNTGLFFPAADTIAATTQGTERLRISSSGNVGIGTNSPSSMLDVSGQTKSNGVITRTTSGTSVGFLGSRLDWVGSGDNDLAIGAYSNNLCIFTGGSSTERLRIDSSGNLLIGTTNPSITNGVGVKITPYSTYNQVASVFNVTNNEGTYTLYNLNATNNGTRFYVAANGGIYNFSANNVNLSDARKKTDIQNAGNYLERICSIPVRTFLYKDQGDDTEKTIGVIAQEVEAFIPELINNDGFGETPEDGIPLKTIYQTDLQYVLMRCIQEQQDIINELKSKVAAMEAA